MEIVGSAMAYHHFAVVTLLLYNTQTAGGSSYFTLLSNYLSASMVQNLKNSQASRFYDSLIHKLLQFQIPKKDQNPFVLGRIFISNPALDELTDV